MPSAPLIPRAVDPGEVVSLTERLGRLQLLRVFIVLAVLAGSHLALDISGAVRQQLWMVSGAYLAAVAITELARRQGRRWSLSTLAAMLLVDGVVLAWITYLTGGTQSPLRVLLYVHLIAVTLLASYRSGLKIALWHSLLSIVVLYAQAADLLVTRESAPGAVPQAGDGLASVPVFNVTTFWVVALVTAAFSALNERELRRRRADSEALATMATEMEVLQSPSEVAQRLLAALGGDMGFGRGVVVAARGGLTVLADRGASPLPLAGGTLDSVVHDAWLYRAPVLAKTLDPEREPTLAALLPDARRVLVIPLYSEKDLFGAVVVEHTAGRGRAIERRLVSVAAQLAAYGALALRNAWLLDRIRQTAATDGLTGVANRRAFDMALARELARARRESGSVSLALLDVDHFKDYNDTHGHLAGDELLKALADGLARESRGHDLVARYGGEEFAIILPGSSPAEAIRVAERLRSAARELGGVIPVTVSVGVAAFPADAQEADALIRAADEALYSSKRAGRDRVTPALAPAMGG